MFSTLREAKYSSVLHKTAVKLVNKRKKRKKKSVQLMFCCKPVISPICPLLDTTRLNSTRP